MSDLAENILALIAAFIVGMLIGGGVMSHIRNNEKKLAIDKQQAIYDKLVTESRNLKDAADQHAIDVEHASIARLADLDKQFQTELANETTKRDKIIADLRTGNKRLFVRIKPAATCSRVTVPGTTASASGDNDQARAELSTDVAERLVRTASLADEITIQLGQCQKVLLSDRQMQ